VRGRLGVRIGPRGLKTAQFRCGVCDGADEMPLMTRKHGEASTAIREGVEGESGPARRIDVGELGVDLGAAPRHLEAERGGFQRDGAMETPAGVDNVADQVELGLAGRLPEVDVGGFDARKLGGIFVVEEYDARVEPVSDRVA
jgi:hypothetical protein